MLFYGAEIAYVFTSSAFTPSARALAALDQRVRLVNRAELGRMIQHVFDRQVPDFNWEEYNRRVKAWRHR